MAAPLKDKSPIQSDLPTTEDQLGFAAYRKALTEIICSTRMPLAIGIFGAWGSGKTSLMRMVQHELDQDLRANVTVWFNAWKYDRQEALWRALILHLTKVIRTQVEKQKDPAGKKSLEDLDRFEQSLYSTVEWEEFSHTSIDWAKVVSNTTEMATDIAFAFIPGAKPVSQLLRAIKHGMTDEEKSTFLDAFRKEMIQHQREQVLSLEQFERQFCEILDQYLTPGQRLVVFIDDLDRCLPENIIQTLEAVKLFLDVDKCVFVLGFDQKMVERAVIKRLDGDEERGRYYLEKIIQLPFYLPPIEYSKMESFLKDLSCNLPDPCCDVFSKGLRGTPREAKRVINIFSLLWQLSQAQPDLKDRITPGRLAKFVIIQHNFRELYDLLRKTPRYLRDLETYFLGDQKSGQAEVTEAPAKTPLPEELELFANKAVLREILQCAPNEYFIDLTLEEVSTYIYLFSRAQAAQAEYFPYAPEMVRVQTSSYEMGVDSLDAHRMEEDFSVTPGGLQPETPKVKVELKAYQIGRYPVTNREYFAFVGETGCKAPKHWDGEKYIDETGDYPVVNVSWEEACLYCTWLSQKTGKTYRLPSEAEWEYAARGKTNSRYPWGNEWEPQCCNTVESNLGKATPVDQYIRFGASWCGCVDMCGNVFEWTSSSFEPYPGNTDSPANKDALYKVLRGGSWNYPSWKARCTYRGSEEPAKRETWIGFRCACEG